MLSYLAALALVAAVTGIAWIAFGHGNPADVVMLYLLAVVAASLGLGWGPSLLACAASVAAFDLFFIPPYLTFVVADPRHLVTFAVMLLVAVVMSGLTRRLRDQAEAARERERRTAALYEMSRGLARSAERSELVATAAGWIARLLDGDVTVFVPEADGLEPACRTGAAPPASGADAEAARWAWAHGREAGLSTAVLPDARGLYVPLGAGEGRLAVLGVLPRDPVRFSDPERRRFFNALAAQLGAALERAHLAEQHAQARIDAERERTRNTLLGSVSHDLRTPLGVIEGAASTLIDDTAALDAATRRDLLQTIREEAERLGRRVRDLLDMTRLEGGVRLELDWHSLEELVEAALQRVEHGRGRRELAVRLADGLPLVHCDGALVEQALVNLLENALKYSPAGSPIEVEVEAAAETLVLAVSDRGPGVPAGEQERIFEKFHRAAGQRSAAGVGLGLAICRAVAAVHGGRAWTESREGGGARFLLALPRQPPPAAPPAETVD